MDPPEIIQAKVLEVYWMILAANIQMTCMLVYKLTRFTRNRKTIRKQHDKWQIIEINTNLTYSFKHLSILYLTAHQPGSQNSEIE